MAQPYSLPADVTDKDILRQVTQAGWDDADVATRIQEGDDVIDSCIAGFGYALPFLINPAIIKQLSILYGKYAVLRDIHINFAPSKSSSGGYERYEKQFNALLKKIQDGKAELVVAGAVLEPTVGAADMQVQTNTDQVPRALDMGDPESQHLDQEEYVDPDRLGNPS